MGYSLNYYNGDYKSVAPTTFNANKTGSAIAAAQSLFNGNISAMVTTITNPTTGAVLPNAFTYQYDQLNRLMQAQAYDNLDIAANAWQPTTAGSTKYFNTFTYDANGNILTQVRNDGSGATFDNLTYNYNNATTTNGKTQNRLYHVNDFVLASTPLDDIEDQGNFNPSNVNGSNNYSYDPIGNLTKDTQEKIDKIEWTVYGKIKYISRAMNSTKNDLKFDYDASGNRIAKHVYTSATTNAVPQLLSSDYYTRDAQGNTMAVYHYDMLAGTFNLTERNLYGSARLGADYTTVKLISPTPTLNYYTTLGNKHFELSNHLNNVLTTVSDRKIPIITNNAITGYKADILSATDYSGFGAPLTERTLYKSGKNTLQQPLNPNEAERIGFGGQEKINDVSGVGNTIDMGDRWLDLRLGRTPKRDAKASKYPDISPYSYAANNPVNVIDPDGKDIIFVNGYRLGGYRSSSDREQDFQDKLRDSYWNSKNKGFTKEIERYFNDDKSHFVSGDHAHGSTAKSRISEGYQTGMEMVNSGEIKVSTNNNIMTVVMHSQGNAEGVGIAGGIIDAAARKGVKVSVNLVFLSVHQPNDIEMTDELKKRGIQFTYANDNMGLVQPMAKQNGYELKDVEDANSKNINWKKEGKAAHAATVDDKAAFNAIKTVDHKLHIYKGKPKNK